MKVNIGAADQHIYKIFDLVANIFASIIFSLYIFTFFDVVYRYDLLVLGVAVLGAAVTLWRIELSLLLLILSIPFLNWLNITGFTNGNILLPISAGVFLGWHIRRLINLRNNEENIDLIDLYACVFTILIALSFYFSLLWSISSHEKLPLPFYIDVSKSSDFISVLTILTGMSLFRAFRFVRTQSVIQNFRWVFFAVIGQVVVLSFIQLIWNYPEYTRVWLHSPFSDQHSFGSVMLLLLFTCLGYFSCFRRTGKILCLGVASLLSYLIMFSYSRITYLASIIAGVVYFYTQNLKKIVIILFIGVVALIVCVNAFSSYMNTNNIYVERFVKIFERSITKDPSYDGRLNMAKRSLQMIRENPLTGTGIGSFYALSTSYDNSKSGYHENAHNYYLQVAAEMGAPAAAAFILLMLMVFLCYKQKNPSVYQAEDLPVKGLFVGVIAYLFTLSTGHALLLIEQQLLFWPAVASLSAGSVLPLRQSRHKNFMISLSLILILLALSGYAYKLISSDNPLIRDANNYGYYGEENWNGAIMRWAGKKSSISVKASGDLVAFNVVAFPENSSGPKGLKLEVAINDMVKDTLHFFGGGNKKLQYHIHGMKGKDVLIKTEVSDTFNPKKLKMSGDSRDLGIAQGVIGFSDDIPQDGIGFFGWEKRGGDKDFKFRWTGGRASIPFKNIDLKQIQILCSHPDIEQNPVVVTVFVDDKLVWKKEVKDKMWKKIKFNPASPIDGKVVTFQVSRTWNPKGMGISADGRDLGVAVSEARR